MVLHMVLALLLLAIPAGALYVFDRSLLGTLALAVGRMAVQLLVLCLIVWALVKFDNIWLSLLWLVLLAVVSGLLALRRIVRECSLRRDIPVVGLPACREWLWGAMVRACDGLASRPEHDHPDSWAEHLSLGSEGR